MVRGFVFVIFLTMALQAKGTVYEDNCLACHKQLSFNLERIFFRYLLKYSDEISVKSALVDFLKYPNRDTSVMQKEYIRSFGLKQASSLSDKDLQKAIDFYWDKYTVFGRLE